jgi:hypothetical protein
VVRKGLRDRQGRKPRCEDHLEKQGSWVDNLAALYFSGVTDMSTPKQVLTAAEAADRIAARHHEKNTDRMRGEHLYTCESCGVHELYVHHEFDDEKQITETLSCECDNGLDAAATRTLHLVRRHTQDGTLKEDHRVVWDEGDFELETEQIELNIECTECSEDEANTEWEEEDEDTEEFQEIAEDQLWEVRCASCDHEIEFGWSHQNRGGRIWPCEAADFNPWKSFPEERFTELWQKRGWLRPLA